MTENSSTSSFTPEAHLAGFYKEVIHGLNQRPRSIPCKYFYDDIGSKLFDEICQLDDYYLTRTELAIMEDHAQAMATQIGPGVMLIEYGSGSSIKTRILLDHLEVPAAYVPVDISKDHLQVNADRLARSFPQLDVLPVCADFTAHFELPISTTVPTHNAVYFPGSTIGNFPPDAVAAMLKRIVDLCGCGGGLLIGIDLQKDGDLIEAAYNDTHGVTARFNLNLLERINRELHGNIRIDQFKHRATYNSQFARIEMDLVSQCRQEVAVGSHLFQLNAGDVICTEHSYKYQIEEFGRLAFTAGLTLRRHWTDPQKQFAVLHFAIQD